MTRTFQEVSRWPEFERDLGKLLKRFRTLEDDLQTFIDKQLFLYHKLKIDNGGIVRIPGLGFTQPAVFKARKFACRSLPGKGGASGIRVIYAYHPDQDRVELVEIYSKGDKPNEDRKRLERGFGRE
jgi:hypothetical protein